MSRLMDYLSISDAFRLAGPRRVARAIRQLRHDAYAARISLRAALEEMDSKWIEEFAQEARRIGLDLRLLNDPS